MLRDSETVILALEDIMRELDEHESLLSVDEKLEKGTWYEN